MEHQLPPLPFGYEALEPFISTETLTFHHDKHHRAYVTKTNELIRGTMYENLPLEELILKTEGSLFNNAAQAYNHSFFWNCLSPKGGGLPGGKVLELVTKTWGAFDKFKEDFSKATVSLFGSGWTWLVQNEKGMLEIINTENADTPLRYHLKPILTLDVWEHAYYIDYRNARPDFVKAFWSVINWDFANENLS